MAEKEQKPWLGHDLYTVCPLSLVVKEYTDRSKNNAPSCYAPCTPACLVFYRKVCIKAGIELALFEASIEPAPSVLHS